MSLCLLWWSLILTFFPCELGERMSSAMLKINDVTEQFNWYMLPAEIQKMFPIIFISVQQPVEIKCFGSIACTRDAFKNVSSAIMKLILAIIDYSQLL